MKRIRDALLANMAIVSRGASAAMRLAVGVPKRRWWNSLVGVVVLGVVAGLITDSIWSAWNKGLDERVQVFEGSVHLGDNIFSRIGGHSLPMWDDPLTQRNQVLIFYDKDAGRFMTYFGVPAQVQLIAKSYRPVFGEFNLGAFRHIVASNGRIEAESGAEYPGRVVPPGPRALPNTFLIWVQNRGNFYANPAVVARVRIVNIFKELLAGGTDINGRRLRSARFVLFGLHGGIRFGQEQNVDLLIDGNIRHISFRSSELRLDEIVDIDVTELLKIAPDQVNSIAVVVKPFQELGPVPPPSWKGDLRGPAHFRDILIRESYIDLRFE